MNTLCRRIVKAAKPVSTGYREAGTCIDFIKLALLVLAAFLLWPVSVGATALSCPQENQISVDFDNGAGWVFCWESKQRENIVLSDIHYRNAADATIKVISSLRLAQLHVAYDDSNITYNDVTQFGLGGGYVSTLGHTDCGDGELIEINGRPGMCKVKSAGEDAYRTATEIRTAESLTLFSISLVGAYSYLVTWKFFDDGSIAPSIGAAGALQRSSDSAESSAHGRELEGVTDKSWLSHTHNYYWRIDFDIGAIATDDVVSEISYPVDQLGRRTRSVLTLETEAARKIDPSNMLAWHISGDSDYVELSPGYVIEPLNYGHRLVRAVTEPFTEFDFFVTRQNDCERFISENAKFNPDCEENVLQFVNDESLIGEDIVVWHRISFHHVPRNEDRHNMHSHWDGFVMQARNLSSSTPGHSGRVENSPPEVLSPGDQQRDIAQTIYLAVQATDPDGERLRYTGTGLPDGVGISESGVISGSSVNAGLYRVRVTVSDSIHTSSVSFALRIGGSAGDGGGGAIVWLLHGLLLMAAASNPHYSRD